jgi:hypothetical protein
VWGSKERTGNPHDWSFITQGQGKRISQVGCTFSYVLQESVKARSTCERHLIFRFPTKVDLRVGSVSCEGKTITHDP